jgi:SAM-dependent methyltransferase
MLKKIYYTFRSLGFIGTMHAAKHALIPTHAISLQICRQLVKGCAGIEVGGLSGVFATRGILPLYENVDSLDNCNFATTTTWEGVISVGETFRFSKLRPPGKQFVAETTNLTGIEDESYDFLLSSHVLEHSANAIQVLSEWRRIVKSGGTLVLLIPHKDGTFDHRRPVTTLSHFIDDYAAGVKEDDLTHLEEILQFHDLRRDPGAGSVADFEQRSRANLQNRCLHHHVFDTTSVAKLLDHVELELLTVEPIQPNHIVVVAQKPRAGSKPDNSRILSSLPKELLRSPFKSDRTSALTTSAD